MSKLILYIAMSLDGFIAKPDNDVKWLEEFPNPEKTDHGYAEFYANVGATLMGRKSYDKMISFGLEQIYPNSDNYVFTRNQEMKDHGEFKFIAEDPVEFVRQLKPGVEKDIWLIGGGMLNTLLFNAGLIDEMMVFVMPIVIGEGIPLFGKGLHQQTFQLIENKSYCTGAALLRYQINN